MSEPVPTEQVLSDEVLAALTPGQRRELIVRMSRPLEESGAPADLARVRRVRLVLLVVCAAALVPWTVYLALTLPTDYAVEHWRGTWVGFDVVLTLMLVLTAVLGLLRRQLVVLTSFTSGVLLACDAWFDVMMATDAERRAAVLSAVLLEVPLACVLMVGALRLLRVTATRLWRMEPDGSLFSLRIEL